LGVGPESCHTKIKYREKESSKQGEEKVLVKDKGEALENRSKCSKKRETSLRGEKKKSFELI